MPANNTSRPANRPIIRRARTDSFEVITAPTRHPVARVLGLLIRLRAEITTVVGLVAAYALLLGWLSPVAVSAIIAVTVAVVLAVPALRRFVSHRAAAVLTRHRLRQVLVERRCLNFSRSAPLFLWSHPTEVGETVWLFLRAGISPSDVENETEWIASGCFARDARVTPVRKMSALVRVEVIRRDPLAEELIASELADWTATTGTRPPRGTRVVPPKPGNQHWSGTGGARGPVHRPTLDDRDGVPPVVIEHPLPTTPQDRIDDRNVVPNRGGDWSDYV